MSLAVPSMSVIPEMNNPTNFDVTLIVLEGVIVWKVISDLQYHVTKYSEHFLLFFISVLNFSRLRLQS